MPYGTHQPARIYHGNYIIIIIKAYGALWRWPAMASEATALDGWPNVFRKGNVHRIAFLFFAVVVERALLNPFKNRGDLF